MSHQKILRIITYLITLIGAIYIAPLIYGYTCLQYGATLLEQSRENPAYLTRSITTLEQAASVLHNEPTVFRYLARAYQKDNRPQDAILALEHALKLLPESLLIRQELFLAYRYIHHETDQIVFDYTPEQAIRAGDASFVTKDYNNSLIWYDLVVEQWPEYEPKIAFRRLLSATLSNDHQRVNKYLQRLETVSSDFRVVRVSEGTTVIPGSELRWVGDLGWPGVDFGTRLNYPSNRSEGFFWWSGQGSVIVEISESSQYLVSIIAQNSNPPPIEMAFGINGQQIKRFSLTKGDNSWSTVEFTVPFSPGTTSIDVWFLNNAHVNNLDRNAIVRQINITKLHQP